jgi:hypothetical protein
MNLLRGIYFHLTNICKKMVKVESNTMVTPILHIHYLNLKKHWNQDSNLQKKKSAASFKCILDKELAKMAASKIDICI